MAMPDTAHTLPDTNSEPGTTPGSSSAIDLTDPVLDSPAETDLDKLARVINADHEAVRVYLTNAVFRAASAGYHLNRAKQLVPHGEWQAWVEARCPFSIRTAQDYMAFDYYLQEMPDMRDQLAGVAFRRALDKLGAEFETRQLSPARKLVDIGHAIVEAVSKQQELFRDARQVAGTDEAWRAFIEDLRLDPAQVQAFIDGGIHYSGDKKRPPLLTLPEGTLTRLLRRARQWRKGHPESDAQAKNANFAFLSKRDTATNASTEPIIDPGGVCDRLAAEEERDQRE